MPVRPEVELLRQITLKTFKGFGHATLGFGPMTLIVGANAAGKSNIRDALRFMHGVGLGYSCAEILGGKYGPGGIQQWKGIRGGAREVVHLGGRQFELEIIVPALHLHGTGKRRHLGLELTYRLRVDVSDERLGPRVVSESLRSASAFLFDSNPPEDPVNQVGEHELKVRQPRGGKYRAHGKISAFPSHTPALSQIPHRRSELASLRGACESVLEVLQGMRFLDLDPDAMRESSPPGQVILGDRGENLSSVLQAICESPKSKESLLAWIRGLTPMDAVDFDFKLDLSGRVLVYLVESSGQEISAVSASDGTLRFLALVAGLLSPDTGQVYFFEEFDNGIHPTRLHLLLELVEQACAQQEVQVVGTTHNPALLAFLTKEAREDAVLAYRLEGSTQSRLKRVVELGDAMRVLEQQDLGRLHASGWLEDAAAFCDDTGGDE